MGSGSKKLGEMRRRFLIRYSWVAVAGKMTSRLETKAVSNLRIR